MISDLILLSREYNDAWNAHNVRDILEFFASDGVLDDISDSPAVGLPAVRSAVVSWLSAFPDMVSTLEGIALCDEGAVAYTWHLKATHRGTFRGVPVTGRTIWYRGIAVLEVNVDGKIRRHTDYIDSATILRQLGALDNGLAAPAGGM
jgi:steroid delta-isomerase-like uncharacterized protein